MLKNLKLYSQTLFKGSHMKTKIRSYLVVLATLLFANSSTFATSETVKGVKKDFEVFKQELGIKLEETQKELDELQKKMKEKGSHVRQETLAELKESRDKLKVEYDNLKFESKSQFQRLKTDLSHSIESLNNKIQKALKDE